MGSGPRAGGSARTALQRPRRLRRHCGGARARGRARPHRRARVPHRGRRGRSRDRALPRRRCALSSADPPATGTGRGAAGGGGWPASPPARCAPPDALGLTARARRRDAHPGRAHQRRGSGPGAALGDRAGLRRDGGFLSRGQDRRRARGERAPRAQPDPGGLSGVFRPASRHHHHRRRDHARGHRAHGPRAHRRLRRSARRRRGAHRDHGALARVAGGARGGGPRRCRGSGDIVGGRPCRGGLVVNYRRGDIAPLERRRPRLERRRGASSPIAPGRRPSRRTVLASPCNATSSCRTSCRRRRRRAPRASGFCAANSCT